MAAVDLQTSDDTSAAPIYWAEVYFQLPLAEDALPPDLSAWVGRLDCRLYWKGLSGSEVQVAAFQMNFYLDYSFYSNGDPSFIADDTLGNAPGLHSSSISYLWGDWLSIRGQAPFFTLRVELCPGNPGEPQIPNSRYSINVVGVSSYPGPTQWVNQSFVPVSQWANTQTGVTGTASGLNDPLDAPLYLGPGHMRIEVDPPGFFGAWTYNIGNFSGGAFWTNFALTAETSQP